MKPNMHCTSSKRPPDGTHSRTPTQRTVHSQPEQWSNIRHMHSSNGSQAMDAARQDSSMHAGKVRHHQLSSCVTTRLQKHAHVSRQVTHACCLHTMSSQQTSRASAGAVATNLLSAVAGSSASPEQLPLPVACASMCQSLHATDVIERNQPSS